MLGYLIVVHLCIRMHANARTLGSSYLAALKAEQERQEDIDAKKLSAAKDSEAFNRK